MKSETTSILYFTALILLRRLNVFSKSTATLFLKSKQNSNSCVIVLHGLGRTALSMLIPALFLRKKFCDVFLYDYISGRLSLKEHAYQLRIFISHIQHKYEEINFLTHSMGGIIVRVFYANFPDIFPKGKTLMLAPPNNGAKIADFFSKFTIVRKILKPLCEIRNIRESTVNKLPDPLFSHAIIAGKYDGKVKPQEAKTQTMQDFLLVNSSHTFIMNNIIVLESTINFFKNGKIKE
ncbi:MAG TPA: hypothetical protein P5270_06105 [Victivallales bacterium]|nr:hypothetical protein [Victivallales bacterium]HPO89633.1 hypothetical protein [Victivallales bacterium]HRR28918.1 hypothetical protein [Victivallales bacterium]HRU00215.1 hypothetical protein [Victivallales bacterium]